MKTLTNAEICEVTGAAQHLIATMAVSTALITLYSGYKLYQNNGCLDAKKDISVKDYNMCYITTSLSDGVFYGTILPLVPHVLNILLAYKNHAQ